jgi:hypothetical protein
VCECVCGKGGGGGGGGGGGREGGAEGFLSPPPPPALALGAKGGMLRHWLLSVCVCGCVWVGVWVCG